MDDGVVIDVSQMNGVIVDVRRGVARVQSGCTLMPLYESLWKEKSVIPGGSCASVGIAGLALGGGFGLLARRFGLTCDNLLGLRMIDSRGKLIVADSKRNPDLFWACRGGGGGNFGVITEFTFRLHKIANVSIVRLRWNWQDMPAVIKAWQSWAPNADDRLTSVLTMTSKAADSLLFLGMFVGDEQSARQEIEPLIKAVKPERQSISASTFIDAARRFSGFKKRHENTDAKQLQETVHIHEHPRFKNTSSYATGPLSDTAINTIMHFLSNTPVDSSCIQFDSYGGAIGRVPSGDTAFCHRAGTLFCMHYQIAWRNTADDASNVQWVDDFRTAMRPHVSPFSYINYCDTAVDSWGSSYYGSNLTRLVKIKNKYDPDAFFSFPQSIRSSPVV